MSASRPLPDAGERMDEIIVAPFDQARIAAYAEVSGDDNPLHLDPAVAMAAGFERPLVHGMLVMSAFEPALREWRPDLRIATISARFAQPLLAGEAARISGRVIRTDDREGVFMRLIAQGPARAPSIIGEAVLVRREAT
jgi:3-hydroxybutyryl-CoA dehydratase